MDRSSDKRIFGSRGGVNGRLQAFDGENEDDNAYILKGYMDHQDSTEKEPDLR